MDIQINDINLKIIGHVYNDYDGKFGIPRQSGLVPEVVSRVVLRQEYQRPEAFRGLSGFSHIWLIWLFSEFWEKRAPKDEWSPTVRPPRLGGNQRVGVFASRSPNRPNPLGLSVVRLLAVQPNAAGEGMELLVAGADILNGTPILDIKPYVPYADAVPQAQGGFAVSPEDERARALQVVAPPELLQKLPPEKRPSLLAVLAQDPRPAYHAGRQEAERVYGLSFAGFNIRFQVQGEILQVLAVDLL